MVSFVLRLSNIMSSAERVRKYREKLKNNQEEREKYLLKERERDRKRREKAKKLLEEEVNKKALNLKRIRDRERQRKHREKLKHKPTTPSKTGLTPEKGSYSSSRSLAKALSKSKKNLPSSPRKKAAVVKKLVSEV